jgi:Fe-S-cluster containining protein
MASVEARKWHRMLYRELRREKPAGAGQNGQGQPPVLEKLSTGDKIAVAALTPTVNPCLNCGACCAFYRASFYWSEASSEFNPGGVPSELTEKLNDFRLAMRGTGGGNPRCIALKGFIGGAVSCSIYEKRASICREFDPSWQNNIPNLRCDKARAAWGLAPLTRESWIDPHNFPKAA